MLAQAFSTSDFFMKDPQVPKNCLFDEGFRERLGLESAVFKCRRREVGTQTRGSQRGFIFLMIFKNSLQEWSFALQSKAGMAKFPVVGWGLRASVSPVFRRVASETIPVETTFSRQTAAFLPGLALRAAWRHLTLSPGWILAFNYG
jgi:hypothetical protein